MIRNFSFTLILGLAGFVAISCQNSTNATYTSIEHDFDTTSLEKAHFASGCFWCVEAVFESVKGVEEVYNGYSGGFTENPTYEDSNTGKTGHAEAVQIWYDPRIITFKDLVDVYFGSQNIDQVNGQGPDHGSQYRTIAFYNNESEKEIIDTKIADLKDQGFSVGSQVAQFEKFWMGEKYHQDYERLHPNQGYIRSVSIPRLNRLKEKFPHLLKVDNH